MKEIAGNIWDYYDRGHWIVITTNGTVRKDGACVMGRGVALEAKKRFPKLPFQLGERIKTMGNRLHPFPDSRLFCYPVKWQWFEKADLCLIAVSSSQLADYPNEAYIAVQIPIYMVRPGCGNGRLDWKDVKPVLEKYLDDRFIVVNR